MAFLKLSRFDWVALGFITVSVLAVFMFEIFVVIPYLLEQNYRFMWFHTCAAVVIVFNLYANLYLLFTTDTSTQGLVMPSKLLPGWHFCFQCEANSPPRAYHCKNCDRCILRRDHHCVFSACCVGFRNYKYYMGLLFQVTVGTVYATAFHTPYVWANMGGFNPMTFFSHCLPVPFFFFGFIESWTLMCNFLSMLCFLGALFSGGLFMYHMSLLLKNQTTHEKQKSVTEYNLKNWRLNLIECLGSNWPLTVFVSPVIDSKLSGDGIHFPTSKDHKYTR